MRRCVSQFVLLVLLGAALSIAASLSASACYGQQDQHDQQDQQGQQPAQQPQGTTPPRPAPSSDPSQESSSKKAVLPGDPAPAATPADASKKAKPGVLPPEDNPLWDPFHAQQDIDVGMFYLHKGDVDAAISRFEDAIRLRADFAKPRILLAECYEKKGDPSEAVRYYKEYLQVLPNAPDAKKVQQKIEKLSKK
jgi:tetratricopeptide (TPR) repeat protein